MKRILLIIAILGMLAIPAPAQSKQQTFLIDRARAIEIFKGGAAQDNDFIVYQEGADTAGKIAVVLADKDRAAIQDALIVALGHTPDQPAFAGCLQIHRGEECTGDARRTP